MTTTPELQSLIERIDLTPVGPEERALIAQALGLAEDQGDLEAAYAIRMRLTTSAHMSGDTDALFSSFAWCVAHNEQDAERFPQIVDGNDLLFQYKWMAGRLANNPAFSLAEVDALTEEMSRRYREAGVSQSGVLQSRLSTAVRAGDLDAAAAFQRDRDLIPRDAYSHCEACVRSTDANLAQLRGAEAESLRLFDEIIAQDLSCGEEPEAAQAEALLPLLRAGRVEEAIRHHRTGYAAARRLADGIDIVIDHLVFLAVTGNPSRGLAILERHIGELGHDPLNEAATFAQLASVAVLLDAVVEAGQGDAIVRGSESASLAALLGGPAEPRTTAAFASAAWLAAEAIAARFDARNGNDYHARSVARYRALGSERHPVALETAVFAPQEAGEPREDPTDAAGWLQRAREIFLLDEPETARAVERGLELAEDPTTRLDLLAIAVAHASDRGDEEATAAAIAARGEMLRAEGRIATAELEARLGALLYGTAAAADLETLRVEERALRAGGDPVDLGRVVLAIADALAREGQLEEALPVLEEALTLTDGDPRTGRRASVVFRIASVLAALGRPEEAVELLEAPSGDENLPWATRRRLLSRLASLRLDLGDAEAAIAVAETLLQLSTRIGDAEGTISAAMQSAAIWSAIDRDDEAASRAAYALRVAERAELPTERLRLDLGHHQLWAGLVDDARETLEELYGDLAGSDDGGFTAAVLFALGETASRQGDASLAYGAWSDAVESATGAEDHALAARAGISLGRLLVSFEDEDAVDAFGDALDAARRSGDVSLIVNAQHLRGRARCTFGDADGLADLDAVHEIAVAEDAAWLAADVTDSRARALVELDRLDDAVPTFERAARELLAAGDERGSVSSSLAAARALGGAGRPAESEAFYRAALALIPEEADEHTVFALELADVLERLGRQGEARELRSRVG